jgi:hypothetical protein
MDIDTIDNTLDIYYYNSMMDEIRQYQCHNINVQEIPAYKLFLERYTIQDETEDEGLELCTTVFKDWQERVH